MDQVYMWDQVFMWDQVYTWDQVYMLEQVFMWDQVHHIVHQVHQYGMCGCQTDRFL